MAAFAKVALPQSVVPDNLPALKDFTAVAVLLCLVFAWILGTWVVRRRYLLIGGAAVLGTIALGMTYYLYDSHVRDIGTWANQPHTRFMVGSTLTAEGKRWAAESGLDPRSIQYVHWIGGVDGIDRAWGDATRNRLLYSTSFVTVAVSLVFSLGLLHLPAGGSAAPRPSPHR
ncbi:MAG TPA: hypothetical protein VFJ16_14290 [Longimicrobium sp.]|nr:hypothetical protein [Longimicrobium sp.]